MHRTKHFNNTPSRLFNNPILNRLSHTSLLTINLLYIPVLLYFLYQAALNYHFLIVIIAMILGAFIWTFIEYFVHRVLFHFKFENARIKHLHSIFHLAHHEHPQDKTKYQTLLLVSIPSSLLFYFLFNYVFGTLSDAIFSGFLFGYIIYEYAHYSAHKLNLPTKIGKFLKQHHMHHHYFNNEKNYGVTSPLWDYIFKTLRKHHQK